MPDDIKTGWAKLELHKDAPESPFLKVSEIGGIADHVAAKLILDLQRRVTQLEQMLIKTRAVK